MTTEALLASQRTFRVWDYRVDHLTLLLRSKKFGTASTTFDVMFVHVRHINLPTTLHGITLTELTDHEPAWQGLPAPVRATRREHARMFALLGADYQGQIVAGNVAWHEDEREWDEQTWWDEHPLDRGARGQRVRD
jgi:hypothetical protein